LAITPFRNEALCEAARNIIVGERPARIDATVLDMQPRAMSHEATRWNGSDRKPYPMKDGIAVIRTLGTLTKRGGWLDADSGLVGYDQIAAEMRAAHRDDDVRGIFWIVDSPGGHTARMIETAKQIAEMAADNGGKPIYAYVDEMACSAGYVLASCADAVLAPESSMTGCLGVMINGLDSSKMYEKLGLEPVVVRSSWADRKARPMDGEAIDTETLAELQKMVDEQGEALVQFVSAMRGLTPKAVKATRGKIYHGTEAQSLGLIDAVCSEAEAWDLLRQVAN
jgi:signal peptide peptidase SppA